MALNKFSEQGKIFSGIKIFLPTIYKVLYEKKYFCSLYKSFWRVQKYFLPS
jgi:hypothetical protein